MKLLAKEKFFLILWKIRSRPRDSLFRGECDGFNNGFSQLFFIYCYTKFERILYLMKEEIEI